MFDLLGHVDFLRYSVVVGHNREQNECMNACRMMMGGLLL